MRHFVHIRDIVIDRSSHTHIRPPDSDNPFSYPVIKHSGHHACFFRLVKQPCIHQVRRLALHRPVMLQAILTIERNFTLYPRPIQVQHKIPQTDKFQIFTNIYLHTIIPGFIGIFKSIGITSATIPESPFDRMPEMLVKQSYRYRFATSRIPFVT